MEEEESVLYVFSETAQKMETLTVFLFLFFSCFFYVRVVFEVTCAGVMLDLRWTAGLKDGCLCHCTKVLRVPGK